MVVHGTTRVGSSPGVGTPVSSTSDNGLLPPTPLRDVCGFVLSTDGIQMCTDDVQGQGQLGRKEGVYGSRERG